MNGRKAQIGFSQRIRLEWFEQTANLILAGNDKATINDSLQDLCRTRCRLVESPLGATGKRSSPSC